MRPPPRPGSGPDAGPRPTRNTNLLVTLQQPVDQPQQPAGGPPRPPLAGLPVGDAALGDAQPAGQLQLRQPQSPPQVEDLPGGDILGGGQPPLQLVAAD